MPVNATPDPKGTLELEEVIFSGTPRLRYVGELYRGARYLSHFAVCPQAGSWRRRAPRRFTPGVDQ